MPAAAHKERTMKKLLVVCAVLLSLAWTPGARAEIITYSFTGHFTEDAHDAYPLNIHGVTIGVGTAFSGSFSYDSEAAASLSRPLYASYPLSDVSLYLGALAVHELSDVTYNKLVTIYNYTSGEPGYDDEMLFELFFSDPMGVLGLFRLYLDDSSRMLFDSTALPSGGLTFEDFSSAAAHMQDYDGNRLNGVITSFVGSGSHPGPTPTPEPSMFMLMALGSAGLLYITRRRKEV